ncbi:hypothetical protein EUX98_g8030 [Antrodiella citrinella]|uniref:SAP domain-containing protein n=1 Tax=Antrodiella citrinella TaxID=2447956 RepID=A0A4S4ME42_9APHY|nr:hypothetical protein EUX98_g8030 [Antrodiella citrinella]
MQASNNFLDEDVPSPEDFPPSSVAPGLRELDESLRCNICKEVYTAPVTIGAPTSESHIRRNVKLEDAVKAWNLARPFILGLLAEEERCRTRWLEKSRTPPPSNTHRNDIGQASPKKRKRSPQTEDEDDIVEVAVSQLERSNLADKGKRHERNPSGSSPAPKASGSNSPEESECPICSQVVPIRTINQHIDSNCKSYSSADKKSKQKQKDGWGKLFGNAEGISGKGKPRSKADLPVEADAEPLPKASYKLVKPKRLREMLQDLELPTTGDEKELVARHHRWVIIFNANLDATQRKSLNQLRRDLAAWEKLKQKKPVALDDEKYERDNKKVYADLIAKARATTNPSRSIQSSSPIDVDGSTPHALGIVQRSGEGPEAIVLDS